jgi:competence protein ComGC
MFRTLLIIAALLLVYLIIKNRLSSSRPQQKKTGSATTDNMVKCLQCETYIPKKEAIISGTESFCCKQHQRDWEKNHKNQD